MNEETCGGPEKGPGRAGEAPGRDQPETVMETPEEPGRGREQRWEAQWQEFLQSLQAPHCAQGSPAESEATPWGDAKAFLASFEQVAVACGWPRGEWVARLLPALSGGAQQAFSLLAAPEREDYGQVKAAILRGEALRREKRRQHFRRFCCPQLGDPRRMYSQVQELCCQWLKPERHSKEQILELLVLEQFLAGMPEDAQSWVRAGGPDSCAQAMALLEDFLRSQTEAQAGMGQDPLQEWAVDLLAAKKECLDMVQEKIFREHAEIYRDPKQKVKEEASLPGLEMAHSISMLPQEDQDMGEDELSRALGVQVKQEMNPREIDVPFHVVAQTPVQSSQQTTFWKVQQQDESEDSLEGSFGPQLGLAPHPVINEETPFPDPMECQKIPCQDSDQCSGKEKRSHKVLNLQEKLYLIKLSEKGMSISEIGRKLGVPRTTVGTIVKNKSKVIDEIKNATPLHTKVIRKRNSLIADMEKPLNVWIEDQIKQNIPLSSRIIQAKAISLFNSMKAERGETSATEKFDASKGWFNRFKARSNLHHIKVQGEAASAASADLTAAEMSPAELELIIKEGGYTTQQIFNVAETGLYWKKMPARTFIAKEENGMPGFKAGKDRLALLLGANAAGDCKLKPLLIYHAENPRSLKNYLKSSLPVYYKSNAQAWMTADLLTTWFSDYFKPTIESYCREKKIPFKILLLLDNAPSHPRALTESFKEIQVVFLPANTTSLLQPMDQGVISTFKSYYLRRTFAKAVATLDDDFSEGSKQNKLKAFWKGFTILDGIKIIRDAWEEVKETTLKGVWKKLIPTLMDDFGGSEVPVEDITLDIVDMARELELEVQPEDIVELLESHNEALTDEDLLLLEAQRRLFREQEALPDDTAQPRTLTTKELEKGIAKTQATMAFWEKVDPNFERSSKVNRGIQNQIACYKELLREKRRASRRQTSLLSHFNTAPSQPSLVTPSLSDSEPSTATSSVTSSKSPFAK